MKEEQKSKILPELHRCSRKPSAYCKVWIVWLRGLLTSFSSQRRFIFCMCMEEVAAMPRTQHNTTQHIARSGEPRVDFPKWGKVFRSLAKCLFCCCSDSCSPPVFKRQCSFLSGEPMFILGSQIPTSSKQATADLEEHG